MPFRYKVKVLSQVAPPAPMDSVPRGPLIAIEGDNADAVTELGKWLLNELQKSSDLAVTLFTSPDLDANRERRKPMVQYHLLATDWLAKSDEIVETISYKPVAIAADSAMPDASPREPARSSRDIDENYDDSDDASKGSSRKGSESKKRKSTADAMDLDQTPTTAKPTTYTYSTDVPKPVGMIAAYSLQASNVFACRIPIGPHDQYSPSDHWQWTATQWRGVVGPDLTIFVRDAIVGESGKPTVDIMEEGNLFVVKRTGESGKGLELDASVLRRLGFEVGEWVRAFGSPKRGSV